MPPDREPINIATTLLPTNLSTKVAAELDQMREDLEDIGVSLCLDDEIMQRCMIYLQRLDELGQRANWLAELVRADDPEARVNDITLNSLAQRLRA